MPISDIVRDISAGTLGYITAGRRGAKTAMAAARSASKRKANGNGSKRKTKRVKKASNGKKKATKKGVVTVSGSRKSKFSKKVQRVLMADQSVGTYTKIYDGYFTNPLNNLQAVHQGVFQLGTSPNGMNLRFFMANMILDAASILFNGKTKNIDYSIAAGNFSTQGLKIHVPYASVRILVKNNTSVPCVMEFTELVTKKNNNVDAYTRFATDLSTINQTGGASVTDSTIGVRVGQMPTMQKEYKMKHKKAYLKPGQSTDLKLFLKDTIFDYDELTDTATLQNFVKNTSVEVLVRYHFDISSSTSGAGSAIGHYGADIGTAAIITEVKEIYKITAPDSTDDARNIDAYCWLHRNETVGTDPTVVNTPSVSVLAAQI